MRAAQKYFTTTPQIAMGTTVADTVVAALSVPTDSLKIVRIKKVTVAIGFTGTAGATRQQFGLFRGTGTLAGGTGSRAPAAIAKVNRGAPTSVCTLTYGPTAITGLSADGYGDLMGFFVNHQNAQANTIVLYDVKDEEPYRGLWLPKAQHFCLVTRVAASVAGEFVTLNLEWEESTY